jgi:CRISPR system Cascade subunit CasB
MTDSLATKAPVLDDTEARRSFQLPMTEAAAVRLWWQRLALSPDELKKNALPPPWPKGVRAVLRRCETPEAVLLTEAFRHLWALLDKKAPEPDYPRDIYAWACTAMVIAELREEAPGNALASELGKQKRDTEKPRMSELRFQQLMECRSLEELVQRLRRALALVDKKGVSVVHLAADILQWNRENRKQIKPAKPTQSIAFQWANDYFRQVAGYRVDND